MKGSSISRLTHQRTHLQVQRHVPVAVLSLSPHIRYRREAVDAERQGKVERVVKEALVHPVLPQLAINDIEELAV
jgi:hypothetical protein